jgi:hypothetical protein
MISVDESVFPAGITASTALGVVTSGATTATATSSTVTTFPVVNGTTLWMVLRGGNITAYGTFEGAYAANVQNAVVYLLTVATVKTQWAGWLYPVHAPASLMLQQQ